MSRTQTKVRTETRTRVLVATLAFLVIAAGAAFGLAGRFSRTSVLSDLQRPFGKTPPGYNPPGYTPGVPPGYNPPGYNPPGYNPPGYNPPGYNVVKTNPTLTNYCSEFDASSACKSAGWSQCTSIAKLSSMPKSRVIKGSGSTLWWYGKDGNRLVFPNEATYRTWFPLNTKCPIIHQVSDATLSQISLGIHGYVTARPGINLVKITTDPKVYAVSKGGVLRWIESEPVIAQLYGAQWKQRVIDLPEQFFITYSILDSITEASQYNPASEAASSPSIDIDKSL